MTNRHDLRIRRSWPTILLLLWSGLFLFVAQASARDVEVHLGDLVGHSSLISCITYSPDKKWLLTCSWDGTARLWDVASGREVRRYSNDGRDVSTGLFSSDGRRVITAGWDNVAHLWDFETGRELNRFQHGAPVQTMALSPSGRLLVTGSGFDPDDNGVDTTVRVWNLETGVPIATLSGDVSTVKGVAFDASESSVVAAGLDGTVRRWDIASHNQTAMLRIDHASITGLTQSPDRKSLAISLGGAGRGLMLLNSDTLQSIATGGSNPILALAFSPDGQSIATVRAADQETRARIGTASVLEVWTMGGSRIALVKRLDLSGVDLRTVAFSPNGDQVLLAGNGNSVVAINRSDWKVAKTFGGRAQIPSAIDISSDGRWIVSEQDGQRAVIWDMQLGRPARALAPSAGSVDAVALSPDGSVVATGSGDLNPLKKAAADGGIQLWSALDGHVLRTLKGAGSTAPVVALRFLPDGRRLLSASEDGRVRLWDAKSGVQLLEYSSPVDTFETLAVSPDGQFLAAMTRSDAALVWSIKGGAPLARFQAPQTMSNGQGGTVILRMAAAVFSQDSSELFTGSDDGFVRQWSIQQSDMVAQFHVNSNVFALARLPNPNTLAAAGSDRQITILDTETKTTTRLLVGHEAPVIGIVASGQKIVSASLDGTLRLWDVSSGQELARIISFRGGDWAVVDREGHFDEPNAGNSSDLFWVAGFHTIDLSQLKDAFYRPGLLSQRYSAASLPLEEDKIFSHVALAPDVTVAPRKSDDEDAEVIVSDEGGGIGPVRVRINGKLVVDDARSAQPRDGKLPITLSRRTFGKWLVAKAPNQVEVQAYNAEGRLLGTPARFQMIKDADSVSNEAPRLWVVAIGITQYTGSDGSFDLQYAANDAHDFAKTMELGGAALFGRENIDVQLLTSDGKDSGQTSKPRIVAAFAKLAAARPQDTVVIYMSGHGLTFQNDYFFPTEDVNSLDISDPAVRKARAISGVELANWLTLPALKEAIVLDTCAAGAIGSKLTSGRGMSTDHIRALERTRDRAGIYVLMGAAANKESYESSPYERGFVTQALLDGMRGAISLKDDDLVSVSLLFDYAKEQVQDLAQETGQTQVPYVFAPLTQTEAFYIASLDKTQRSLVPYHARRPIMLRPVFLDKRSLSDDADLSTQVADVLVDSARDHGYEDRPFVYFDSSAMAGGTAISGLYERTGNTVDVDFVLGGAKMATPIRVRCLDIVIAACARRIVSTITSKIEIADQSHR